MFYKKITSCKYISNENIFDIKYDEKNVITSCLSSHIKETKKLLDNIQLEWTKYKKFTNPYEFIGKENDKFSISQINPISRAYYKFTEIFKYFNLNDELPKDKLSSFHLAEGPGGFIEALNDIRKNPNDKYIGMTLKRTSCYKHKNAPYWFRGTTFLANNPHVSLEYGITKTGDITNIDNLIYCMKSYPNKFDFMTGDAGFDFSSDYDNQETDMYQLLYTQIIYAIVMQKYGGSFILKIFDMFDYKSAELIYLLSMFYNTVYICKPKTSRIANGEKYVVCKGFKYFCTQSLYQVLINTTKTIYKNLEEDVYISSILNIKIPITFMNNIEDINVTLGQQQIENINMTLSIIKNDNRKNIIYNLYRKHITLCGRWCNTYDIPYKICTLNKEDMNI